MPPIKRIVINITNDHTPTMLSGGRNAISAVRVPKPAMLIIVVILRPILSA
jgi:hypothetical protein